jgi:hypothetical protein
VGLLLAPITDLFYRERTLFNRTSPIAQSRSSHRRPSNPIPSLISPQVQLTTHSTQDPTRAATRAFSSPALLAPSPADATCLRSAACHTLLRLRRARPPPPCYTSRAAATLPADADLCWFLFSPASLQRPPRRLYLRECALTLTPEHVLTGERTRRAPYSRSRQSAPLQMRAAWSVAPTPADARGLERLRPCRR